MNRIRAARDVIDPAFLDSPLYRCDPLGERLGCAVSIKLETANPVRSFKGRGTELVTSRLAAASAVVCASAGNLGQALAWSGRRRGLDVTVVARRRAPAVKLDRIRSFGARLELVDGDFEAARERAVHLARERGIRLVEDSLDVETCEGAATIGLELIGAVSAGDVVLIALGGGAMATGVGHVLKSLAPGVEVICVQPRGAPAMTLSWRERRVVTTEAADTIADGVAGRFPIPEVLDDLLAVADDAVLVREDSIKTGMRLLLDDAGLVAEPSAALGVAAVLEDRRRFAGRHVVTIVCGGNVDPAAYRRFTSPWSPGRP
ncbi:threonine dehydratase [Paractinoplanes abujensis]|uniref:Threonine dehydratase n=1 Tax=Paractinoplanes abujensis TaxID=882441 RepID=A0A7W7G4B1_9ACTN|nr:pyridoxal-phosphate dependent enzyme [Actinoplanes abujensis]MBB4693641.1 threonine dehydratase [Actinoplanes abujensis]GID21701.1 threonine dehydratase [Actinoplanes abujensis]